MAESNPGRPWSLLFISVFTLLMVGTVLYAQFYFSKRADDALCSTLIEIVERSSDSIDEHPYYQRHPDELDVALEQNNEVLTSLRNACPE